MFSRLTQMLTYFVRNGQKEAVTIAVIDVQAMQRLYQKGTFYRNCSRRINDTASIDKGSISATVLTVADSHEKDSFAEYVLAKFVNDDVGNFCRTDVTLMKIGKSLWQGMRCKPGKKTECGWTTPRHVLS